jgi:serine/threonine protein kinase
VNRKLPPHPNVVQVFGVSLDGDQPVIVMEYCTGGTQTESERENTTERERVCVICLHSTLTHILFDIYLSISDILSLSLKHTHNKSHTQSLSLNLSCFHTLIEKEREICSSH